MELSLDSTVNCELKVNTDNFIKNTVCSTDIMSLFYVVIVTYYIFWLFAVAIGANLELKTLICTNCYTTGSIIIPT